MNEAAHAQITRPRGRGAGDNPDQRFTQLHVSYEEGEAPSKVTTKFFVDHSQSIITTNNSPDLASAGASIRTGAVNMAAPIVTRGPRMSIWASAPDWTLSRASWSNRTLQDCSAQL